MSVLRYLCAQSCLHHHKPRPLVCRSSSAPASSPAGLLAACFLRSRRLRFLSDWTLTVQAGSSSVRWCIALMAAGGAQQGCAGKGCAAAVARRAVGRGLPQHARHEGRDRFSCPLSDVLHTRGLDAQPGQPGRRVAVGGFAACACALCRTVLPEAPLIDTCWQISCSQAAAAIVAAARAAAGGRRLAALARDAGGAGAGPDPGHAVLR